jgi:copper(I)-binding protein
MLIGLNQDLNVGDSFTVTLELEKAGEISLDVVVKEP